MREWKREWTREWMMMFGEMEDLWPCYSISGGTVGRSFYCLISGVEGVLKAVDMCMRATRNDVDYMDIRLH